MQSLGLRNPLTTGILKCNFFTRRFDEMAYGDLDPINFYSKYKSIPKGLLQKNW